MYHNILFETERLRVRYPDKKDADDFFILNSDPEIVKHIRPVKTREESDSWFADKLATNNANGNGLGAFAVEDRFSKEFLGSFAIFSLVTKDGVFLGYSFKTKYWGKGYATELTIGGIQYGFVSLKLNKIFATTTSEHIASQKVLLKSGFTFLEKIMEDETELNEYVIYNNK